MVVLPLEETLRGSGRWRQMYAAVALMIVVWLVAAGAHAHGRPPSLNQVVFDPNDPAHIVAQATWGAVVSEDGGASWRWLCAASMGVRPRNQDPRMLLTDEGRLVVGTFDGLVRSDVALCEYESPDEDLADEFVIDLAAVRGATERVYALRTSSFDDDQLFVSDDGGASFTAVGEPVRDVLLDRLVIGVDDPSRLYLSGAIPRGAETEPMGFVIRSDDGGETLTPQPITFEGREWSVLLLGVDPTDADRLLVDLVHFDGEEVPERVLLSEDGGATWETVTTLPQVGGAAFSEDGTEVLLGSRIGGLLRSVDGGRSFALLDADLTVRCIARRGTEVFVCTDPTDTRVALLRSDDGGETFAPALHFDQIRDLPDCTPCSEVGIVCPAWFVDVAYDLELDAAIPDGAIDPDAGTGLPRDASVPEECLDGGVAADAGIDATRDAMMDADGDTRVARGGGGCSAAGSPGASLAFWPLIFLALLLVGCGGTKSRDEVPPETRAAYSDLLVDVEDCRRPPPPSLSREQMLADVDVLERILRRGYAGFEIAGSQARWSRAFEAMRRELPDPPADPRAFRDALIEALQFADDNHLGLSLRSSDGERSWRGTSGHAQAFYGDVVLTRTAEGFVDEGGMRLVSCGERAADEAVRPFAGATAPDVVFRPLVLSRTRATTISCTFEDGDGESEREVPLARVDIAGPAGPVFEEKEGAFPWLRVRSLATSYQGALDRFVATAPSLGDAEVIVLDVRRQGGGSDRFLLRWFKELTSEGLPYFRTRTLESEVTLQGALNFWGCIAHHSTTADDGGRAWLTNRIAQARRELEAAMVERGPFREVEIEHDVIDGQAPAPFGGRLLLVTDRGCASACETSVLIARHFPGTLVVGENTNGTMKVGELRSYRLPRSGITVSAGHRVHEDPSHPDIFPEGVGYQPDLWLDGVRTEERIAGLAQCLAESPCAAQLDAALGTDH